ncbi:MAG: protein-L-isoaspartate(D-aspartate) O-methyltransferase [Thermoguttaceae bacterium]|jgi:protein-L-isoaspartate(D-aspartate) O-methyltransferase
MSDPDLETARAHMLHRHLEGRGIRDRRVLAAMAKVPRERFIEARLRDSAYADQALGIACGQTISQPYIVGLMTQALDLFGEERVLEVGTGSGYQAAVLAELAREVVTIERHETLSRKAGEVLTALGYTNVTLAVGDGTLGWPPAAPYDRVVVTAAAARVPPALLDQLVEGGTLVIPLGGRDQQLLQAVRKVPGGPAVEVLCPCRFVPLVGGEG